MMQQQAQKQQSYRYATISKRDIGLQQTGFDSQGNPLYRLPIFDLKVKTQKKSSFSRIEENERAKELFGLGFFNPEKAQEALPALEMMTFEGIDKVKEYVKQGDTLFNIIQQMSQQLELLSNMLGITQAPVEEQGGGAGPTRDIQTQEEEKRAGARFNEDGTPKGNSQQMRNMVMNAGNTG